MRHLLLTIPLIVASLATSAQGKNANIVVPKGTVALHCEFRTGYLSNSTPGTVDIYREPGADWQVMDPFLAYFKKPPQQVEILVDNPKRTTYGWTVKRVSSDANKFATLVNFRLTLIKATRQASIAVQPVGFRSETAWGRCLPLHTF
ncbi:hypothetical protein [Thioclava pacifica]|uniref:Secreted protein n=1 Tax=Thioclava pacifica DSM 10166 TaxID=1353537 RepID=A0A074J1Z9_9RHOB|nr:hypothetical protein [Thioclava pacifica]KEO50514.1 hypothetical protein TP2_14700 [Thioclava pacifica DSM 10166]